MASSVDPRLAAVHPKMVAVGFARRASDRKPLAPDDWKRQIGQTIDRALVLARLSKQAVSYAMGYADQSAVSRWIAGTERPLFDKLFAVAGFYEAWLIACADVTPSVDVETTIVVRKRA